MWVLVSHSSTGYARGGGERGEGEGGSESIDGRGCAILALEVVPKNLIFA